MSPRRLYFMTSSLNLPRFVAVLVLLSLLAACTSRYRLNLYLVEGEARTKVKVEKTEYIMDGVLGDPMARDKVAPGEGNCLILVTGSRGQTLDSETEDLVSYDRYVRYRIFLQLPLLVVPGKIDLSENSFVQLMGHYERAADEKMYFPQNGTLVVDSLSGKRLFGDLEGSFANQNGESVTFQGKFKAKVAR